MRVNPPKDMHYLNLGPWPNFVGFTTSEKAFNQEIARLGLKEVTPLGRERADATTHFFVAQKTGAHCTIIFIPDFKKSKFSREQYAALIAHEATHVVQEMQLELARGKSLGHEAEAYLVQQIVQETLQIAWSTGKSKRIAP